MKIQLKPRKNVATDDVDNNADNDEGDDDYDDDDGALWMCDGKLQAHRTSHSIRTENSKETSKQNKYEIRQQTRLDSTLTPALCRFFQPSVVAVVAVVAVGCAFRLKGLS